ncbi:flagellin [Natranaerovirga pectinivora]|uniref:Flagellin n=1 Tax=Natranaerovirga pectinivora TaxID=682400 RepID=A0A4R3MD17_9FIRM|nr:flagellin [Natranaerovirga pectinivora]TCT11624.1 flagellin [Natranaerovirga pectinivora]
MRINHNIPALKSLHQLSKTNSSLDRTLERLSSGLRINRASDDAAGLAITQKMDTQVRGLDQAKRNAMDGISMIQTAEGALAEVHAMLQRIRELSVQVSNGTYDANDRRAVQDEVNQLKDEILRISQNIEFNERKLLNGDIDRRAFPDNETVAQIVSLSDAVKPGSYELTINENAKKAAIVGVVSTIGGPQVVEAGTINLNGEEIKIEATDTAEIVFNKLRSVAETIGANLVAYNGDVAQQFEFGTGMKLVFEMKEYGSEYELDLNTSNTTLLNGLGLSIGKVIGLDAKASINTAGSDFLTTATVSSNGNVVTVTDINGFEMKFEAQEDAAGKSTVVNVLNAGPLNLQIGANEGQTMEIRIQNLSPKAIGIDKINLSTAAGAQKAISTLDSAINMISSVRSKLGAYQNRLEHTVANLGVAGENMTASLSRILDADMAYEMSEYTQKSVLAQAGTAMLAQANQRPQSILQLLQG